MNALTPAPLSPAEIIDLQIMWNRLIAVVEEQGLVLLRTAFSTIVREAGDLSAGVFDLQGRMLAQAVTGTPGHVNSMAEAVRHFIRHFPLETMHEGDAYITNDPWMGTGHLNDFVVTTPAFHRGKLVGLFSCTSHLMDIGGLGSGPEGLDVFMEGLYIPMLKLIERGRVNETLMAMIRANTRLPVDTEGDTYSLAGCNDVGCRRLSEMMDEFGIDSLDRLADYICDRSQEAVLTEVAKLPQGTWSYDMQVDGYEAPIGLRGTLTVSAGGMHMDYTGSGGRQRKGINVPLTYATAYTVYGMGCLVASSIPNNAGSLAPLTVSAPPGCVLNAQKPAPVSARSVLGMMLPDMVFGCLRQAAPHLVPAEGANCLWNIPLRGARRDGTLFANSVSTTGGTGGRATLDGLSCTGFPSGIQGTPVEIAETQSPVLFWRKEFRAGSGGAGRTRGGLGQTIEIESAEGLPFALVSSFDRVIYPARGQQGGENGAVGHVGLASGTVFPGKGRHEIPPGERLVIMTPGGAGNGPANERDPARVAADIADGLVTEP
jgi:N-methylhydantoinase B